MSHNSRTRSGNEVYPEVVVSDIRHAREQNGEFDFDLFAEAVDTAAERIEAGDRVLVHCHAGISHSPAVTAAAIDRIEGIAFEEALDRIRERRGIISPNRHLMAYGHRYDAVS